MTPISETALVGISEELERVQRELRDEKENGEKYRLLCVEHAKTITELMTGFATSHDEIKRRLFIVEEERDALRDWYKDAEKRLDRIEDSVKRFADHLQGQAKYGTPPLSADGVNTSTGENS